MTQDKDFLETEPVGKLLLHLALPTVAAQIINMLYNMVDRIYIGHIPDIGGLALTGVGVCMPLIMIVSAFAALVGSGGAPRASIFMGQGNIDTAEKTLGNCFSMQLIISVILTIILFGWNKELLLAFGASESIILVCFNSSLLKYGGDLAVGAMTILASVMQFAMLPLQGLGQGAQPIISYNFGSRNPKRVKQTFWLLLKTSVCYSSALWVIVMLLPQLFIRMFTPDAALLEFTKIPLRIYMAVLLIFGIQMACQLTFNAIGNARASIIVAVMRKFILLIPLIYMLPSLFPQNPTFSVYLAEPVADFFAVCFTAILFMFQFKKSLQQISDMPRKQSF